MKYTKLLTALPMPLRLAGVSFLAVFTLSLLCLFVLSSGPRTLLETFGTWAYAAIGAAALILGLVLALDYHGSASAYVDLVKAYRSENSWMTPFLRRYVRVFGAGLSLVGVCFVVFPLLYLVPWR